MVIKKFSIIINSPNKQLKESKQGHCNPSYVGLASRHGKANRPTKFIYKEKKWKQILQPIQTDAQLSIVTFGNKTGQKLYSSRFHFFVTKTKLKIGNFCNYYPPARKKRSGVIEKNFTHHPSSWCHFITLSLASDIGNSIIGHSD